jgi:hypothetical protein
MGNIYPSKPAKKSVTKDVAPRLTSVAMQSVQPGKVYGLVAAMADIAFCAAILMAYHHRNGGQVVDDLKREQDQLQKQLR